MNEDWSRLQELFERAVGLDLAERARLLASECAEPPLRQRVEELLLAHDAAGEFLSTPREPEAGFPLAMLEETGLDIGRNVGPYKLLQRIGEGGFGVVYMAEQRRPITRKVALKVIKLGMNTKQVIARFEQERQALALMEHSHIARILDAGETENGRPYFVMELVHGIPITEYCDRERLTIRQRLELFIPVCHAVAHAHQKGVIHRDLKPTNVLVTLHDGKPVPKVIDFGIARAMRQRIVHQPDPADPCRAELAVPEHVPLSPEVLDDLTARTLFTEFGDFVGTPEYMSPEQGEMSGLDIDTRSDVYSLGLFSTNCSPARGSSIPGDSGPLDSARSSECSGKRSHRGLRRGSRAWAKPPRRRPVCAEWTRGTSFVCYTVIRTSSS